MGWSEKSLPIKVCTTLGTGVAMLALVKYPRVSDGLKDIHHKVLGASSSYARVGIQ
jgi:hypothetical protein